VEYVIVAASALFVSGLTLLSGFGLGTLLLPVFALFLPVEVAVAATAVVHGANNILKVSLLGSQSDWNVVLRFGLPAILAAFIGAAALGFVSGLPVVVEYSIGSREAAVTPVKLVMGVLMVFFALFELLPTLRNLEFDRKLLTLGGVLSGFFGGLSGHQGALRSAFLAKVGLSTVAFVATNAVVGLLVDLARISIYGTVFLRAGSNGFREGQVGNLVLTGIVAAFAGVLLGKRFIGKVTMRAIQILTGTMLLGIAIALGIGLI
jgi:hypothetical protein